MRPGRRPIPPGAPGHPRGREPGPERARRGAPGRVGPERDGRGRAAARLAYEDDLILAYDKPAGLPVIAPEGSRARCLLDIATERVRRHNHKGRAAVVHRIDRDTSGIVVFAMNAQAKRILMSGWDDIVSERRYVALVRGRMEAEEGIFDSYLIEGEKLFVRAARAGERGAKRAVSRWRVLSEGLDLSLVEIFLETGRKHQIRVQFADAGHPVAGDPRYGRSGPAGGRAQAGGRFGRDAGEGRLFLHAAAIELRLPGRDAPIRIESPAPPDFLRELNAPRGKRPSGAAPVGRAPSLNAPRGGASASRREARSGAPRAPAARRGKKSSSRP